MCVWFLNDQMNDHILYRCISMSKGGICYENGAPISVHIAGKGYVGAIAPIGKDRAVLRLATF